MTDRITEAELQNALDHAIRGEALTATQAGTYEMWATIPGRRVVGVERLIAEVRRLRGLIWAFADDNSGYDTACIGCGDSSSTRHADDCPWLPLEAEARAIREEQGRG